MPFPFSLERKVELQTQRTTSVSTRPVTKVHKEDLGPLIIGWEVNFCAFFAEKPRAYIGHLLLNFHAPVFQIGSTSERCCLKFSRSLSVYPKRPKIYRCFKDVTTLNLTCAISVCCASVRLASLRLLLKFILVTNDVGRRLTEIQYEHWFYGLCIVAVSRRACLVNEELKSVQHSFHSHIILSLLLKISVLCTVGVHSYCCSTFSTVLLISVILHVGSCFRVKSYHLVSASWCSFLLFKCKAPRNRRQGGCRRHSISRSSELLRRRR